MILLITVGCNASESPGNNHNTSINEGIQKHESNDSDGDDEIGMDESTIQEISNASQTSKTPYELNYERYEIIDENENMNILIEYPQITGMNSLEMQKTVNSILKEKAIHVYDDELANGLNLQLETQIKYFDSNIISVRYSGYEQYHDTMNTNDVLYATNINLITGELLSFNDVFNDELQEKLNREIFKYNGLDKVSDEEEVEQNTHEYGYINADESIISDMFEKYIGSVSNSEFYFSGNSINLIVKVPDGPTAYLELEADLDDLRNCIKDDIIPK